MVCPYFREEMDKGFLQSNRDILWYPKKKKMFIIPFSSDDIPIAGGLNGADKESYFCKKCRKLIVYSIDD